MGTRLLCSEQAFKMVGLDAHPLRSIAKKQRHRLLYVDPFKTRSDS
jgi:hypothetical protein